MNNAEKNALLIGKQMDVQRIKLGFVFDNITMVFIFRKNKTFKRIEHYQVYRSEKYINITQLWLM